jgi:eukaryotic-like serine/threonine-protein kinase
MTLGAVLGGKYRLEGLLGQGGMGSVWRARNLKLDAPVAVKLMDPSIVADPNALMRFHREAHAGAAVRSPHVLQVFDHDVDARTGHPYIVMELLEGEPLRQRIERVGLTLAQTEVVVRDVCRGLSAAHEQGIVHRDLKPDNVFLERNQDEELAKILDFGIAKAPRFSAGLGTQTGVLMGTPFYMSPEQIRGARHVDTRSDLWSLAVIVYECLTGRRPFQAETIGGLALAICSDAITPASQWARLSPAIDTWFERALARDPAGRFQTAAEFGQTFTHACLGAPAGQSEPLQPERDRDLARPEPLPASASASRGATPRTWAELPAERGALGTPGELEASSPSEPSAVVPAAPAAASGWAPGTRQMLLGYGLTALLMFGSFGYSAWMQTRVEERVTRLSPPAHVQAREAAPPPEHPSELAASARRMARWLPGLLIPIGVMGASLWRFIARKRQSADV